MVFRMHAEAVQTTKQYIYAYPKIHIVYYTRSVLVFAILTLNEICVTDAIEMHILPLTEEIFDEYIVCMYIMPLTVTHNVCVYAHAAM